MHDTAKDEELNALHEGDLVDAVATYIFPSTAPSVRSEALEQDTFKLNEELLLS